MYCYGVICLNKTKKILHFCFLFKCTAAIKGNATLMFDNLNIDPKTTQSIFMNVSKIVLRDIRKVKMVV